MRDLEQDYLDSGTAALPEIGELEIQAAKLAKDNAEISEARLAEGFAKAFAGKLAYAHDAGLWMRFDGAAWRPERRRLAYHFAVEYCRAANTKGDKKLEKAATADAVEKIARARPELAVEMTDFDPDALLIGTPGGIIDLTDGSRRPALASDRISKLTAIAPESGAPLRWLTFLHEATGGDADLIRFLRQWCGYCLTGLTREHALLFVYGPGGNGKSVFLNIVSRILADYATTAPMETFAASHNDPHPTGLAMLRGARLVCASETEEGRAWAESRIKAITGGDPITARFMRQDFFTFTPAFKLTIAGNHQPVLRNVDDAARRRFNIVPFTRKPAQPDPELETKLWDEAPRILQWMIDGALDWQEHGLLRPASVTKATASYFETQDTFGQWIEEKCRVEPDNRHLSELTAKLFESWSGFAKECGEPAGTSKSFSGLMQKRGLAPERIHRLGRGYRGIELAGKPYAGN